MTSPFTPQAVDERLTQLEIKLAYADDLLDALNVLVARQHDQIQQLLRDVALLRRQRDDDPQVSHRTLRDELPPHY